MVSSAANNMVDGDVWEKSHEKANELSHKRNNFEEDFI